MSALRGNIEALEATLGRQNLLVITLTTCRPTDDADFQTRFRKFTRDLNKQNLIWVAKIERQETGGQHAHVVAGQADL